MVVGCCCTRHRSADNDKQGRKGLGMYVQSLRSSPCGQRPGSTAPKIVRFLLRLVFLSIPVGLGQQQNCHLALGIVSGEHRRCFLRCSISRRRRKKRQKRGRQIFWSLMLCGYSMWGAISGVSLVSSFYPLLWTGLMARNTWCLP